jgi:spore coat protein U-like protein
MNRWVGLLAACAAVMPAGAAVAGCATFRASSLALQYDPLGAQANSDLVEPVSLQVQRQPGSPLPTAVAGQFVDRHGQIVFKLGGAGPAFTVRSNEGLFVIVGNTVTPLQPFRYFATGFPASPAKVTRPVSGLQFIIPAGQDVPAGTYQESIDIQFRCLTGPGDDVQRHADITTQTAVLPVTIIVPNKISANLAGGQTHGVIDFQDFAQLSHRASIQVRSTGPYNLLISSENSGKMLLEKPPAGASGPSTSIAYSLTYGGTAIALGAPTSFGRTGVIGQSVDLTVTAESVGQKRAGDYRDTLTVTLTPASI